MIKNHSEFLQFAFKAYDNPKIISLAEFEADLKRFGYMNTMLSRYHEDEDECKLRTAVNHIVIIANCFGPKASVDLIRFKMYDENVSAVETIMYFLNMVSDPIALDFILLTKLENS